MGCPVAGRTDVGMEPLMGCFTNTLPLRAAVRSELSFREFLAAVRDKVLAAFRHQGAPFEKIVEAVNPLRAANVRRVFQTLFNFRNLPAPPAGAPGTPGLGELHIEPWDFEHGLAQFDLALTVAEHPGARRVRHGVATGLTTAICSRKRTCAGWPSAIECSCAAPWRTLPRASANCLCCRPRNGRGSWLNGTTRRPWVHGARVTQASGVSTNGSKRGAADAGRSGSGLG